MINVKFIVGIRSVMLAQSFVFKLLDLKKSSITFLTFLAFCLFCSIEMVGFAQQDKLGEVVIKAVVLDLLGSNRDHILCSPIANGRPTFDGPPGNESILSPGYVVQSPMTNGRPTFDGPPGNEKSIPSFDPGPPGNE